MKPLFIFTVGMVAGATGAFIGTPAEISLIRMTSDGRLVSIKNILKLPLVMPLCRLPIAEQRGYKNVFDALFRITREEGLFTLWRVSLIVYVGVCQRGISI